MFHRPELFGVRFSVKKAITVVRGKIYRHLS